MEVILSTYPEELSFPAEIAENVRAAAEKAAELYGVPTAEVSITLTDNAYIHELNRQYRNIDRPTDVLSFALNESEEPDIENGPDINVLGDIILSVERAEEQAADYGHSLRREIAFLTVHGMLHLLGYDHMEEADRLEMEKEQRFVMEKLGIPREQVMAIGDSGNDAAMLDFAGVGVAMGNGEEALKQKADLIAPTNEEGGVADMLELAIKGEI